ncbi:8096_t:CDS:2, partial [Racocetra persica]
KSRDGGRDIIIILCGFRGVVQCKAYFNQNIERKHVDELRTVMRDGNFHFGSVVGVRKERIGGSAYESASRERERKVAVCTYRELDRVVLEMVTDLLTIEVDELRVLYKLIFKPEVAKLRRDFEKIKSKGITTDSSEQLPISLSAKNETISKKGTDKLRQELFNTSLEPSSQDHSISKNIKPGQIMEYMGVSQYLAQLCDTAIDAEDRASKANQEEIMCWSLYGRNFEFQVDKMSSKNKIGEKKARTLIYNEIENQLSIL